MVEVADRIHTTPNKVCYWLKKYEIPRRSWSESSYVKQNPNGDPFKVKENLSDREKEILIAGLMLFLGEGGRRNKHSIQLGNLNPEVIQIFIEFLRKICRVKEDKIKLSVRLHKKFSKPKARTYWSKTLGIPKQQVLIYDHYDSRSKLNRQHSEYGLATLIFSNMKLKKWLDDKIKEQIQKLVK